MPLTDTRLRQVERILGMEGDEDPGTLVFIASNAWPAADRTALAAAQGPPMRGRAFPDVATMHQITDAAEAIIARRTGFARICGVIDVPAPDYVLELDGDAREAWLDEHESRPWKVRRGEQER